MYDKYSNQLSNIQEFKKSRYLKVNLGLIATVEKNGREHLITKINSHSHIIPTIIQQF
jgi:hypothetical protein